MASMSTTDCDFAGMIDIFVIQGQPASPVQLDVAAYHICYSVAHIEMLGRVPSKVKFAVRNLGLELVTTYA